MARTSAEAVRIGNVQLCDGRARSGLEATLMVSSRKLVFTHRLWCRSSSAKTSLQQDCSADQKCSSTDEPRCSESFRVCPVGSVSAKSGASTGNSSQLCTEETS